MSKITIFNLTYNQNSTPINRKYHPSIIHLSILNMDSINISWFGMNVFHKT